MVRLDLPFDLVEKILSRVPAASLRRLRFTCKRWNDLFNDPEFIKRHSDKAAKENSVLMLRNFRVYSLSVNLNEIHNPSISQLSRSLNESEQVEITQVFHCNDLLLCSMREANKTKLVVVNPCTGQTRWIEPRSVDNMYNMFALGYENNNNNNSYDSYKIMRFPFGYNPLEIFDLKTNSWRVLTNIRTKEDLWTYGRDVSLKGNSYWVSCFSSIYDILSFNFRTERFRRLRLPTVTPKSCMNVITLSVVRDEQLLVLHKNIYTHQLEIWVSNKIDDTKMWWSISFTLDLCSLLDHRLFFPMSFLIDEEKKVVVSCGRSVVNKKNMIHIITEHGCRKFDYDTEQSNHCWPFLFSYVPSLVSLNPPM